MAQPTPHTDETRAAALAALMTGQSVSAVAATYKISRSTLRSWRAASGMAAGPPPVDQEKQRDLGALLGKYLDQVLLTLAVQAKCFSDETWLKKQPASEAAVLHGVLADKAIRLLEALQAGEPGPALDSAGPGGTGGAH